MSDLPYVGSWMTPDQLAAVYRPADMLGSTIGRPIRGVIFGGDFGGLIRTYYPDPDPPDFVNPYPWANYIMWTQAGVPIGNAGSLQNAIQKLWSSGMSMSVTASGTFAGAHYSGPAGNYANGSWSVATTTATATVSGSDPTPLSGITSEPYLLAACSFSGSELLEATLSDCVDASTGDPVDPADIDLHITGLIDLFISPNMQGGQITGFCGFELGVGYGFIWGAVTTSSPGPFQLPVLPTGYGPEYYNLILSGADVTVFGETGAQLYYSQVDDGITLTLDTANVSIS